MAAGTDHAGIAVQAIIDRKLDEEGLTKHDISATNSLSGLGRGKRKVEHDHTSASLFGSTPDWHRETLHNG